VHEGRARSVSMRQPPDGGLVVTRIRRAHPSSISKASKTRGPCAAEAPPTWTCTSEAVDVCLFPPNRKRIAAIALVVGTLLVAINQGGTIASGDVSWVVWIRVALDIPHPCVRLNDGRARRVTTQRRGVSLERTVGRHQVPNTATQLHARHQERQWRRGARHVGSEDHFDSRKHHVD